MSSKEVVFVKKEQNIINKTTIDLTCHDSDSDIEPEVDKIADVISININTALKNSLQPFVSQYNSRRNQHQVISGVLKQLPEFQKLVAENAELKMALNNIKNSIHTKNEITLEVKEKENKKTDSDDNIDLQSVGIEDGADNTITSCINDSKKKLMESFYNSIECESDEEDLEPLNCKHDTNSDNISIDDEDTSEEESDRLVVEQEDEEEEEQEQSEELDSDQEEEEETQQQSEETIEEDEEEEETQQQSEETIEEDEEEEETQQQSEESIEEHEEQEEDEEQEETQQQIEDYRRRR